MSSAITQRLQDLGLVLPVLSTPVANYVAYVQTGNLVVISGQLPIKDGAITCVGKLGRDVTIEQGKEAAKLCALYLLAQVQHACGGDLSRVKRCVRVGGFVNSTDDFVDQPQIVNGASDVLVAVLGDAGRHARTSLSVNSLPRGAAVEVEAIFEIE
jgi:enamine deaminase RidA (YjgF/YER057c/UK114 family)